jgi:hypothetical protein
VLRIPKNLIKHMKINMIQYLLLRKNFMIKHIMIGKGIFQVLSLNLVNIRGFWLKEIILKVQLIKILKELIKEMLF